MLKTYLSLMRLRPEEVISKIRWYIQNKPDLVVETVNELLKIEQDPEYRLVLEIIRNVAQLVKLRHSAHVASQTS